MIPTTVAKTTTGSTSNEMCATTMIKQKSPSIEVVNEIQIIANKRDNPRSLNVVSLQQQHQQQHLSCNNKETKRCVSSRSSKTDLTAVTTPTTATLDTTAKNVTVAKNSRRSSKNPSEKDKSETNSTICMCGKLLKRVKELLEAKETKAKSE